MLSFEGAGRFTLDGRAGREKRSAATDQRHSCLRPALNLLFASSTNSSRSRASFDSVECSHAYRDHGRVIPKQKPVTRDAIIKRIREIDLKFQSTGLSERHECEHAPNGF
jgi:hypothetical protein